MPTTEQILANADEYAERAEGYDPKPGDRERIRPEVRLRLAALKRDGAESELADVVRDAHEHGMTWAEIGDAIGETAEKAERRYGEWRP